MQRIHGLENNSVYKKGSASLWKFINIYIILNLLPKTKIGGALN